MTASRWQYFSVEELQCPCCKKMPMNEHFMAKLVAVRRELGIPIHINSGYRCPKHNKDIGGRAASKHLLGRAVDIGMTMSEADQIRLLRSCIERGLTGIGVRKTFVHFDDTEVRLWGY